MSTTASQLQKVWPALGGALLTGALALRHYLKPIQSKPTKSAAGKHHHCHKRHGKCDRKSEGKSCDSKSSAAVATATATAVAPAADGLRIADRLSKFTAPTVWHEFTPLAQQSRAVNLGQGFPGWSPPEFVVDFAVDANREVGADFMVHQYARSAGEMSLAQAVAKRYTKTLGAALGRPINPLTEVVTTNGATEAIFISIMGLLNPGDEVVTIEPAFDIYWAQADMAGAVLKTVPLRVVRSKPAAPAADAKDTKAADGAVADTKGEELRWVLDMEEFASAFSAKTRMLILNTPQNPTGKVFTRSELEQIAALLQRYPSVVVVADEVYEHLTYARAHTSIASLPGMFERTISVGSAGKTFSVTGWKVGWCVTAAPLARALAIAHQWDVFSISSTSQVAIARALERAEQPYKGHASYYEWLNAMYRQKRTRLAEALKAGGITPIMPEGGFFIMGDTSALAVPEKYASDTKVTRDWALCRWLTLDIGVAAIPPSSFYCDANKALAAPFARFAFCKPDEVLDEAAKRLTKLKAYLKPTTTTTAAQHNL